MRWRCAGRVSDSSNPTTRKNAPRRCATGERQLQWRENAPRRCATGQLVSRPAGAARKVSAPRRCAILASGVSSRGESALALRHWPAAAATPQRGRTRRAAAPRARWSPWPAGAAQKVSAPRRCAILTSGVGSRGESALALRHWPVTGATPQQGRAQCATGHRSATIATQKERLRCANEPLANGAGGSKARGHIAPRRHLVQQQWHKMGECAAQLRHHDQWWRGNNRGERCTHMRGEHAPLRHPGQRQRHEKGERMAPLCHPVQRRRYE